MARSEAYSIRSFIIFVYDASFMELGRYMLPIAAAAPFGNRIIKEVLQIPDWQTRLREPWFTFEHHYEREFRRSQMPVGPTSLYGIQYDPASEPGPAIQMHPGAYVRSFVVRVLDLQQELFSGEYAVDDIFLHGAHFLLSKGLAKGTIPAGLGPYYYAVLPSTHAVYTVSADILPDEAYDVEGVFRLPPRVKQEPRIQFRRVPAPPLDVIDAGAFPPSQTFGKGAPQAGRILIPARLYDDLRQRLTLSEHNEEGGYVLGNAYRQPGSPEDETDPDFRWVVEVTDLLMAENALGTPVTLLFTGDTWSLVSRRRDREYADRKLVGWFHTHIFPASDTFGLSGLDQDMHAWYLARPWQVAILLNLENDGARTVRCYQRGPEGNLVETPYEVFEG